MYFIIGDEHYYHGGKSGHDGIIKYCNRPFDDVEEMNEVQIENNNSVVKKGDIVIHAGDFTLLKDRKKIQKDLIDRLNGTHIFLKGSHDYWMPKNRSLQRWEGTIDGYYVVVDHYAMHTWARSHYNSWHLYAHSHRDLGLPGKRHCVSADNTDFFPLSFDQVKEIMQNKPDNPNFIKPEDRHNVRRS